MISSYQRAVCSLLSVAGALTLVMASAPAVAAEAEARTARVAYGDLDLDLGRAAGRATFERRLAVAAVRVCADQDAQRLTDPACLSRAKDQARRDAGLTGAVPRG